MIQSFESNVYIDPLTGLPNFFKFIETDVEEMFKGLGTVVIFDMVKFGDINTNYGIEAGDLFLREFSSILKDILANYEGSKVFRTHGDEFTVILQGIVEEDAEKLIERISCTFKDTMLKLGFDNASVHTLILDYSSEISSINQFYQMIFTKYFMKLRSSKRKFSEEKVIESIIGNFTNRIKETLSLLNDAYSLALTDDISELPNQRAAKIYLKDLIQKERIFKNSFTLLFIDGDNLKRYNNISYEAGNEMIRSLASVISKSLRKNDKVFRWLSGDEFLVVLEDVETDIGIMLAERIRAEVESETKAWAFPITVSIGLARYPEDGRCIEEVIAKAEKANVYAKESGKNKVICCSKIIDKTLQV